jgi:hypothetical protein
MEKLRDGDLSRLSNRQNEFDIPLVPTQHFLPKKLVKLITKTILLVYTQF